MAWADVPVEIVERLRSICCSLPDAYEEQSTRGARWRVRTKNFAEVMAPDSPSGPTTIVMFRAPEPEVQALERTGHPFFGAGWGKDVLCVVLDDRTDWDEVTELLTGSYCHLAPKKLAALVESPE